MDKRNLRGIATEGHGELQTEQKQATLLRIASALCNLILATILSGHYFSPYFIDEETKVQRGWETCLMTHS